MPEIGSLKPSSVIETLACPARSLATFGRTPGGRGAEYCRQLGAMFAGAARREFALALVQWPPKVGSFAGKASAFLSD